MVDKQWLVKQWSDGHGCISNRYLQRVELCHKENTIPTLDS